MNAVTEFEAPTIAGALFGGGIYAGRCLIGDEVYALVVAPKDEGDLDDIEWNASEDAVDGAASYVDGRANTDAMVAAGSELAAQIRALRIGGHDDWYLASRLESLVIFSEIKPTPAFDFQRDWYWTSTQLASYPDSAWCQDFYGGQGSGDKGDRCRARAVRRILIR